jgi:alkaline phosphatase
MYLRALSVVFLIALVTQAGAAATRPKPAATLLAAGDIADCSSEGAQLTATLVESLPGTVAALGDTAYPSGSASDFANCYDPTWGRFKNRTRPALGNHEYVTGNADAYFAYFGRKAAPPGGYYSYELGSWHVVVVNSNCDQIGGCGTESAQMRWLRADLAHHPTRCTVAYWHHPRFSSGPHAVTDPDPEIAMQPIWATLAKAGAEIVLNGHEHLYQRFAPLKASGRIDLAHGMREFIVGTGGGPSYPTVKITVGSKKVVTYRWGVLRLELANNGYRWAFLAAPGGAALDSGSGSCH